MSCSVASGCPTRVMGGWFEVRRGGIARCARPSSGACGIPVGCVARPHPPHDTLAPHADRGAGLHPPDGGRIFDGSSGLLCASVGQGSRKVFSRTGTPLASRHGEGTVPDLCILSKAWAADTRTWSRCWCHPRSRR